MRGRRGRFFLPVAAGALLLAGALLSVPAAAEAADTSNVLTSGEKLLPVSEKAPLFEAPGIDGTVFDLAGELSSGPVFLVFWSIFCGSCREELPVLESEKSLFSERNTQVVAVNLDEASRVSVVQGFADQQGFTFRIVMNKTEERSLDIDKSYLVAVTPTSYLIDREGRIVAAHAGPLTAPELKATLDKLPSP